MTWMMTGRAGYIGAHVLCALQDAGMRAVVLDSLSTGRRSFVPDATPFIGADINDTEAVRSALLDHGIIWVIHVAGFKYAEVSVQQPLRTYRANVAGTTSLLEAMQSAGVQRIVFSSSAATYGTPDVDLVTEQTRTAPVSHTESPSSSASGCWPPRPGPPASDAPRYGPSTWSAPETCASRTPPRTTSSRSSSTPSWSDVPPRINGDDYPTRDGTCVRDYVHVADLALAHVAAARRLEAGQPVEPVYNLGSGQGTSVRQIMETAAAVTGIEFTPEIQDRRPGDPARIVADGQLAARDLDWRMRHSLEEMIASAWAAHQEWSPATQRG